jgi:hypothetical protein
MLDLSLAVTIFSVTSATVFGAYAVVQNRRANRTQEEQTAIMRQGLETNIAKEIADALSQVMRAREPGSPSADTSPIAAALQTYVDQRIVQLQNRVIEPTFLALTKRVATAEKGMKQLAQREVEQEQRVRRGLHHIAAQIVSAADE